MRGRVNGTTAESPIQRFERDERQDLTLLAAKAPFVRVRELSRRYQRGSILMNSNCSVAEWGGVSGDAVAATACQDRLLHHSRVITIRGDSYRLRTKRRAGLANQASANTPTQTH